MGRRAGSDDGCAVAASELRGEIGGGRPGMGEWSMRGRKGERRCADARRKMEDALAERVWRKGPEHLASLGEGVDAVMMGALNV